MNKVLDQEASYVPRDLIRVVVAMKGVSAEIKLEIISKLLEI